MPFLFLIIVWLFVGTSIIATAATLISVVIPRIDTFPVEEQLGVNYQLETEQSHMAITSLWNVTNENVLLTLNQPTNVSIDNGKTFQLMNAGTLMTFLTPATYSVVLQSINTNLATGPLTVSLPTFTIQKQIHYTLQTIS